MARYIDAEKLEDIITKLHTAESIDGQDYFLAYDVLHSIRIQPIEEVTPIVWGKWNDWYFENGYTDAFHCQKCQHLFAVMQGKEDMNFCPNCGAKMKEREKEE